MGHPDIDNLDHDPDLAIALGNMVVAWARAETALVNVFALVTGVDFNMATVAYYRIPSFEARCKVIQAILAAWQLQPTDRRDALTKAVEKLSNLAVTRNGWIHSVWCLDEKADQTVVFDFRSPESSPRRRRPVKAHDVLDHVAAVKKRTAKIEDLVPLKIRKITSKKR